MHYDALYTLLLLSLAAAAISYTTAHALIWRELRFEIVYRTWDWQNDRKGLLGELATCQYCQVHYVAFALVLFFQPRLFHLLPHFYGAPGWLYSTLLWAGNFLVASFSIVSVATLVTNAFRALGKLAKNTQAEYDLRDQIYQRLGQTVDTAST